MAATQTVLKVSAFRDSVKVEPRLIQVPRTGVLTLWGYGIKISVDRGHLILEDGIGSERRSARLPRIGHALKRLIVIGGDGFISLAALRWLTDQKAAFVMLERNGSVLATTGPVHRADARLRRSQACLGHSESRLDISRHLITMKLVGQERIARNKLRNARTADAIASFRNAVSSATTIDDVRTVEARAGAAYWTGWSGVEMRFPKKDAARVPEHWLTFGSRTSPLSSFSLRVAINPINAILNYVYAVLESETRLAISAMGLDPGMGLLHLDSERRDSLACDLMEVIRPHVDGFLFDWLSRTPFRRNCFFEERNGNCRLMGSFAATLSETAPMWRRAVAPVVEWFARTVWENSPKMAGHRPPAQRLTQSTKRKAHGGIPALPRVQPFVQHNLCRTCGAPIMHQGIYCRLCNAEASKKQYVEAATIGRKVALSAQSQARRKETQMRNARAQRGWIASKHPAWLDQETYVNRILPRLSDLTASAIADAIQISLGYADSIRKGKVHPHARHWQKLAALVGVVRNGTENYAVTNV